MTKEVLVSIIGMHTDVIERGELLGEPMEVITPANYFQKNGKHYILYTEVAEGIQGDTKNKIKITNENLVEVIKTGITGTHMVFEKGKRHLTAYQTPYGQLMMGIRTNHILLSETEEEIRADINYNLDINEEAISECDIVILVRPKSAGLTFS